MRSTFARPICHLSRVRFIGRNGPIVVGEAFDLAGKDRMVLEYGVAKSDQLYRR